mgnify:CR=1
MVIRFCEYINSKTETSSFDAGQSVHVHSELESQLRAAEQDLIGIFTL